MARSLHVALAVVQARFASLTPDERGRIEPHVDEGGATMKGQPRLEPFDLWGTASGGFNQEIAGEAHHRAEIRRVVRGAAQVGPGEVEWLGTALLRRDPGNRYDRNAIAVECSGSLIGYLPAETAEEYAPRLDVLARHGMIARTQARIWARDDAGTLRARAQVSLPPPHLLVPSTAPPPGCRLLPAGPAIQVQGEEQHADALARWLRPEGSAWVHATLHLIDQASARSTKQVVEVRIDGERVGQLTPRMSAELSPAIALVESAGGVACVRALVTGNALKSDVTLRTVRARDLTQDWIAEAGEPPAAEAAADAELVAPLREHGERPPLSVPHEVGAAGDRPRLEEEAAEAASEAVAAVSQHRHWDGQRWLAWDGQAWVPEGGGPPLGIPAGWYTDPQDPSRERYWTGSAWGGEVRPRRFGGDILPGR